MNQWSLTLHGLSGISSSVDSGETQFVMGSETAADVWTISDQSVLPRHAWVAIAADGMQVEDLGGGTLVNGQEITGRVQVDYPASVQVGDVTLLVETKAEAPVTLPQELPTQPSPHELISSTDVTIPHRPSSSSGTRVSPPTTDSVASNTAPLKGAYTLVREIARGGMGQIYFGEDPQLKRDVAVKVSSVANGGEDPRFSKEAEVLAHLAHPNIVPIYNNGVDAQGRPFYSMKLVKGRTLQSVLNAIRDGDVAATKEYTRAALLTVFRKVCDAMAFAHAKGVLHRDLKPENIMVGEYGEVLVMDWGLAKVLGERDETNASKAAANDTGDYGMTMEGEVMGTPQYMSPEQAEGMVAELDPRSDIYSLGGILYALLTLRPPIEGTTLNEVLTKVKKGEISEMATKRSGRGSATQGVPAAMGIQAPEALRAVTLKAMATDRNKRYANVEAFARDIEAYQNGFATSAEDAGAWKRVKLWVGRNKVLSGAAALLVIVVSAFTGKVVQEGRRATRALQNLAELGPLVAKEAEDSLREGKFEEALSRASYAVELDASLANSHAILGHALEVCDRWEEAAQAYRKALQLGFNDAAKSNLSLVEELLVLSRSSGVQAARLKLQQALTDQKRTYEAVEYARLSTIQTGSVKDPEAGKQLVKRLESELLPVPGTGISMQKTEFTVGEWKLYLAAQGLPPWENPESKIQHLTKKRGLRSMMDPFPQTDEHPVVFVAWDQARDLCRWLTKATGDEWRLPREHEWLAASADQEAIAFSADGVPQANVYIENRQTGMTAIPAFRSTDTGIAGVYGTVPVGSFKPNALGFHDLVGNVWEFMWDGAAQPGDHVLRGGGWRIDCKKPSLARGESDYTSSDTTAGSDLGFRLVMRKR